MENVIKGSSLLDAHGAVVEKLDRARELISQLRDDLLPTVFSADPRLPELAGVLLEKALESSSAAISLLQRSEAQGLRARESAMKKKGQSRRLRCSWNTLTSEPHIDGYQWKKYGQKWINGSKFPRSYHRCIHKDDQGCQAIKKVQQVDENNPANFMVTNDIQHSCSFVNVSPGGSCSSSVVDSINGEDRSDSYRMSSLLANEQIIHGGGDSIISSQVEDDQLWTSQCHTFEDPCTFFNSTSDEGSMYLI